MRPAAPLFLEEVCFAFVAGVQEDRSRRKGGRAVGGSGSSSLYRVSPGDQVDVHLSENFVNSSLAPVVLLRGRLKCVVVRRQLSLWLFVISCCHFLPVCSQSCCL